MVESAEGIGSRKWSLLRQVEQPKEAQEHVFLMEGANELARLDCLSPESFVKDKDKIRSMLVAAPQLWEAANVLIRTMEAHEDVAAQFQVLKNMVAKSVGKDDWSKVQQ